MARLFTVMIVLVSAFVDREYKYCGGNGRRIKTMGKDTYLKVQSF